MKTAIYIEDGTVQLVITPEGEFERNAISSFNGKELAAKIFTGSFYDCRGGWVRQNQFYNHAYEPLNSNKDDKSIIIRIKTEKEH